MKYLLIFLFVGTAQAQVTAHGEIHVQPDSVFYVLGQDSFRIPRDILESYDHADNIGLLLLELRLDSTETDFPGFVNAKTLALLDTMRTEAVRSRAFTRGAETQLDKALEIYERAW